MRTLEIILILALLLNILTLLPKSKRILSTNLLSLVLLFIVLLLHLFLEGFRMHMTPAYLLSLLLLVRTAVTYSFLKLKSQHVRPSRLMLVLYFSILFGSIVPPIFFPAIDLPETTGQFAVGTKYILLTDTSRVELFELSGEVKRNIPIQVFYPVNNNYSGDRVPYFENASEVSRLWTEANGFNSLPFLWNHLGQVKTNSIFEAPIAKNDDSYPVIIFGHGYWQFNGFNTIICEELASHGYVVLSLTHEYETGLAVYPNGDLISFSMGNEEFQRRAEEHRTNNLGVILKEIHETEDSTQHPALWQRFYDMMPLNMLSNNTWVDDILFVIDNLHYLSANYFEGQLDTNSIGTTGFSFGGAVAGLATLRDERIGACVSLDGFQYGHLESRNFECPMMFMLSEGHGGQEEYFVDRAEAPAYSLEIKGTLHTNFNDIAFLAEYPGKIMGNLGPINGAHGLAIIKELTVFFFDQYLKEETTGFLNPIDNYPEVILRASKR